MSKPAVFRSSKDFIFRQLALVDEKEQPKRRLELDIADILTGPTSAGNAQHLADSLCGNRELTEVCERMIEAANRYLNRNKQDEQQEKT